MPKNGSLEYAIVRDSGKSGKVKKSQGSVRLKFGWEGQSSVGGASSAWKIELSCY